MRKRRVQKERSAAREGVRRATSTVRRLRGGARLAAIEHDERARRGAGRADARVEGAPRTRRRAAGPSSRCPPHRPPRAHEDRDQRVRADRDVGAGVAGTSRSVTRPSTTSTSRTPRSFSARRDSRRPPAIDRRREGLVGLGNTIDWGARESPRLQRRRRASPPRQEPVRREAGRNGRRRRRTARLSGLERDTTKRTACIA